MPTRWRRCGRCCRNPQVEVTSCRLVSLSQGRCQGIAPAQGHAVKTRLPLTALKTVPNVLFRIDLCLARAKVDSMDRGHWSTDSGENANAEHEEQNESEKQYTGADHVNKGSAHTSGDCSLFARG